MVAMVSFCVCVCVDNCIISCLKSQPSWKYEDAESAVLIQSNPVYFACKPLLATVRL